MCVSSHDYMTWRQRNVSSDDVDVCQPLLYIHTRAHNIVAFPALPSLPAQAPPSRVGLRTKLRVRAKVPSGLLQSCPISMSSACYLNIHKLELCLGSSFSQRTERTADGDVRRAPQPDEGRRALRERETREVREVGAEEERRAGAEESAICSSCKSGAGAEEAVLHICSSGAGPTCTTLTASLQVPRNGRSMKTGQ